MAVPLGGRLGVDAPALPAYRVGLREAAITPNVPGERWHGGIAYRPNRHRAGGSYDPDCTTVLPAAQDPPAVVEWDPFVIYHDDKCNGYTPRDLADLQARAEATLEAQTGYKVETAFWTNTVEAADFGATHPNVSLADSVVEQLAGGAAVGLVTAWRELLEFIPRRIGGGRALIHVPAFVEPYLNFYALIIREGFRVLTASGDHQVVLGSGYTGTSPAGVLTPGNAWIYATTPVELRLGPITTRAGEPFTWIDRLNNVATIRVERAVLPSFDRQLHLGIQACLEDPGPACLAGS